MSMNFGKVSSVARVVSDRMEWISAEKSHAFADVQDLCAEVNLNMIDMGSPIYGTQITSGRSTLRQSLTISGLRRCVCHLLKQVHRQEHASVANRHWII